jgi:hypothetical protein
MLYICIFSNKFDLIQAICVSHKPYVVKAAMPNLLAQGGQLYRTVPFSKDSLFRFLTFDKELS